ncbi:MAG: hypothetical protein EZS28_008933, partial [Streblomastix strix]
DCPCLSTGDPRAGNGQCPAYCVKGQVNDTCVCDPNSSTYPYSACQLDKLCITNLINQTATDCPCLSTNDPRAGNTCPFYCTSKDTPNKDCVCDSNPSAQYPPTTCLLEKGQCTASSGQSVPTNSCTCTGANYPYGCQCPTDSSQLIGIPQQICDCRATGDPRAGTGECPSYCVKGYTNVNCVCDTGSSIYPSESCEIDKQCIIDLIHQTKADCPCLMKGDPRAGGICPSYCISKYELTIECMCELGSLYPQAQCERDKLCIVDLIHQSTSNCPCLEVDDPRGESICKQTDIDPSVPDPTDPIIPDPTDPIIPDPTDPIIPDPTEKDPETEQEQEEIIKQEDEKEKQEEESTIFKMIQKQEEINKERKRKKRDRIERREKRTK